MFAGSLSEFVALQVDASLRERVARGRLDPSGPLWGRGRLLPRAAAREFEEAALAACGVWRQGLEAAGLEQQRRALRLWPVDLRWEWPDAQSLSLAFELPPGAYATAVLRELLQMRSAAGVDAVPDED
jgi:tRNA pseudouridine13 synthase